MKIGWRDKEEITLLPLSKLLLTCYFNSLSQNCCLTTILSCVQSYCAKRKKNMVKMAHFKCFLIEIVYVRSSAGFAITRSQKHFKYLHIVRKSLLICCSIFLLTQTRFLWCFLPQQYTWNKTKSNGHWTKDNKETISHPLQSYYNQWPNVIINDTK